MVDANVASVAVVTFVGVVAVAGKVVAGLARRSILGCCRGGRSACKSHCKRSG